MANRNQTPGENMAFGCLGVIVGITFFAAGISMIVAGKASVRGRHGVFITPQNDPWGFWIGVVLGFVAGAITLVVSARAIIKSLDD